MSETKTLRVGISCGDLNGIGLEVVLKTFEDSRVMQDITPILYASSHVVSHHRKVLGLEEVQFHGVDHSSDALRWQIEQLHESTPVISPSASSATLPQ